MQLTSQDCRNIHDKIIYLIKEEVGEKDLRLSDISKIISPIVVRNFTSSIRTIRDKDKTLTKEKLCEMMQEMIYEEFKRISNVCHNDICEDEETEIDILLFTSNSVH